MRIADTTAPFRSVTIDDPPGQGGPKSARLAAKIGAIKSRVVRQLQWAMTLVWPPERFVAGHDMNRQNILPYDGHAYLIHDTEGACEWPEITT
jgi:hypothetical protein